MLKSAVSYLTPARPNRLAPLSPNLKMQVQSFWQNAPCDSWFTSAAQGTEDFYRTLDEHRYKLHRQLTTAAGFEKARGLRVLRLAAVVAVKPSGSPVRERTTRRSI